MSSLELRCSLATTALQTWSGLLRLLGLTQASNVMPLVRCSEASSGTVTRSLVPLNRRAPPYFPAAVRVAPLMVPLFPSPEASSTVAPLASPKSKAATRLGTIRSSRSSTEGRADNPARCAFLCRRAGFQNANADLLTPLGLSHHGMGGDRNRTCAVREAGCRVFRPGVRSQTHSRSAQAGTARAHLSLGEEGGSFRESMSREIRIGTGTT